MFPLAITLHDSGIIQSQPPQDDFERFAVNDLNAELVELDDSTLPTTFEDWLSSEHGRNVQRILSWKSRDPYHTSPMNGSADIYQRALIYLWQQWDTGKQEIFLLPCGSLAFRAFLRGKNDKFTYRLCRGNLVNEGAGLLENDKGDLCEEETGSSSGFYTEARSTAVPAHDRPVQRADHRIDIATA